MKRFFLLLLSLIVAALGSIFYFEKEIPDNLKYNNSTISVVSGEPSRMLFQSNNNKFITRSIPQPEIHSPQKISHDDLIAEIISQPESSPAGGRKVKDLRKQILAEKRDKAWANNAEIALSNTLSSIPYLNDDGKKPDVHCQSTICEVSGAIQQDANIYNKSIALERLQKISQDDLKTANISKPVTYAFMSSGVVKGKNTFLIYFDR